MALSQTGARELITRELWPAFQAEKTALDHIDKWWRWEHDKPHSPRAATVEYRELASRAQTPWLSLVVTSVVQNLYVDGYRQAREAENADAWQWWQANGMDARQIAIHESATAYGLAYASVLPGEDPLTAERMPVIKGHSPRRMIAFYEDPSRDDWPAFALQCEPSRVGSGEGWTLSLFDDTDRWTFTCGATGDNLTYITTDEHGLGVCPVVRYANRLDLEARATGEVEPFIAVAGRIDQTVFDRLVVQRFASWVVRTIAGMARPDSEQDAAAERLRLRVEDLLIAEDPETKFGSLPATELSGFVSSAEFDIRTLAAVSQTPSHEMLGQMVNLSAEALAAAEASLQRKIEQRQTTIGEAHEQLFRLAAHVMGDTAGARDVDAQVRWRDMESRSLAQAADALGKMATMLGVPVEALWERVPGVTDQDVQRWKALAEEGGALERMILNLNAAGTEQTPPTETAGAAAGNGQNG